MIATKKPGSLWAALLAELTLRVAVLKKNERDTKYKHAILKSGTKTPKCILFLKVTWYTKSSAGKIIPFSLVRSIARKQNSSKVVFLNILLSSICLT